MSYSDRQKFGQWEKAELGDDKRNEKFMRLMGSGKKENKEATTSDYLDQGSLPKGEIDTRTEENQTVKEEEKDEELLDVRSANAWERATTLGDNSRKNKFLRLMGAGKKEHTGKFVIGDKQDTETSRIKIPREKELEEKLENQYQQGLELKLTGAARRHIGFGFREPSPEKQDEGSDTKNDVEQDKKFQERHIQERRDRYQRTENHRDYKDDREDRHYRSSSRDQRRDDGRYRYDRGSSDRRNDQRSYNDQGSSAGSNRYRDRSNDQGRNSRWEDQRQRSNRSDSNRSYDQHQSSSKGSDSKIEFNSQTQVLGAAFGNQPDCGHIALQLKHEVAGGQFPHQQWANQTGIDFQKCSQLPPPPPPLPTEAESNPVDTNAPLSSNKVNLVTLNTNSGNDGAHSYYNASPQPAINYSMQQQVYPYQTQPPPPPPLQAEMLQLHSAGQPELSQFPQSTRQFSSSTASPPQTSIELSQTQSSIYKKPTMTFVKSSDS